MRMKAKGARGRGGSTEPHTRTQHATEIAGHRARGVPPQVAKLKDEIKKLTPPPPKPKEKPKPKGWIDLDEGPDAPPISEQLGDALRSNSTRVIDLFRSWDADGDGEVGRVQSSTRRSREPSPPHPDPQPSPEPQPSPSGRSRAPSSTRRCPSSGSRSRRR